MRARMKEPRTAQVKGRRSDYLFNWKSKHWPHEELRKLVDTFESSGTVEETWRCSAHRQIHIGDRAYFLSQDTRSGIFGRGHVVGTPFRGEKTPGKNPWQVPIRFDASRGDVLVDPWQRLLVEEEQLLRMPAAQRFKGIQKAGEKLESGTARQIDRIIAVSTPEGEAAQEIERQKKLGEQARRPGQQAFSETIRWNYRNRCAVTGCVTPAALEAAHISTRTGHDDNSAANGILLRSDIHTLFDRFLITLSEDCARVEVGRELTDPSYAFLKTVAVARPDKDAPSTENLRKHRDRFFESQKQCSGNLGDAKGKRLQKRGEVSRVISPDL